MHGDLSLLTGGRQIAFLQRLIQKRRMIDFAEVTSCLVAAGSMLCFW
jgi:hypothetical protein